MNYSTVKMVTGGVPHFSHPRNSEGGRDLAIGAEMAQLRASAIGFASIIGPNPSTNCAGEGAD